MFEVGKSYKTFGGWEAKIIWMTENKALDASGNPITYNSYVVVHKPHSEEEVIIDGYFDDGSANPILSISNLPLYTFVHPAWLTNEEWV